MKKLDQSELNFRFVQALEGYVERAPELDRKPLDLDLRHPLLRKLRVYIYNMTHPGGGRTLGEHKIQLIVPGQNRGERGDFDESGARSMFLVGFEQDLEVFVLWDAGMYRRFSYSGNVQVRPETVLGAYSGGIACQQRRLHSRGIEIVVAAHRSRLVEAMEARMRYTLERLLGGTQCQG